MSSSNYTSKLLKWKFTIKSKNSIRDYDTYNISKLKRTLTKKRKNSKLYLKKPRNNKKIYLFIEKKQ